MGRTICTIALSGRSTRRTGHKRRPLYIVLADYTRLKSFQWLDEKKPVMERLQICGAYSALRDFIWLSDQHNRHIRYL